jgi:predicted RNA-binding protein with EMAP domain
MAKLPEVNFILINPENIKEMPNITPILKNSKPLVMILSGEYIHKRFSKWLIEEMHYELVELDTHRQLWKKKRLLGQL